MDQGSMNPWVCTPGVRSSNATCVVTVGPANHSNILNVSEAAVENKFVDQNAPDLQPPTHRGARTHDFFLGLLCPPGGEE